MDRWELCEVDRLGQISFFSVDKGIVTSTDFMKRNGGMEKAAAYIAANSWEWERAWTGEELNYMFKKKIS